MEHECKQHEKFEKMARLTGQVEEAVSTIKKDIDQLFELCRTIVKDIGDLKDELKDDISDLKGDMKSTKVKFAILGSLGVVAAKFLFEAAKGAFNG